MEIKFLCTDSVHVAEEEEERQAKSKWSPLNIYYERTLEIVKPRRLAVVFRGECEGVEEDKYDDGPVQDLRLAELATKAPHPPIHFDELLSAKQINESDESVT